jgi:hypothetical protein
MRSGVERGPGEETIARDGEIGFGPITEELRQCLFSRAMAMDI